MLKNTRFYTSKIWGFFCCQIYSKMATKKTQKTPKIYVCNCCDFNSSNKKDYTKHLATLKHQKGRLATDGNQKNPKIFTCIGCKKEYNDRSGLWKHQHKCIEQMNNNGEGPNNEDSHDEIIKMVLKDNNEIKQLMIEQTKQITKLGENATHNIHNNNKTFNMTFFLNETCKNAMNIDEFVSSIKPTIEELEETGKVGYVAGITNVIIKRLTDLEVSMKPMHCSDEKRETLYIKDNDIWEKDVDEKPLITSAIKMIAHKNMKNINKWQTMHPDCCNYNSKHNNEYLKIISNAMAGGDIEEINRNTNRIVSNIAKKVLIEKINHNES